MDGDLESGKDFKSPFFIYPEDGREMAVLLVLGNKL